MLKWATGFEILIAKAYLPINYNIDDEAHMKFH